MSPSASTSDVDVVVIGAGNAGLTAAVRLAQSGTVVNGPEARIRRSEVRTGHTHACTAFPVSDLEVQLDH